MNKTNNIKPTLKKPIVKKVTAAKKPFEINVFDIENKIVSQIQLDEKIWGGKINAILISRAVQNEQASWRQATKKAKNRGEVSGGGRKPWRQKGTGRARAGSIRSPIWRGGGITFGPTGNENYRKSMNKKEFKLALQDSLKQFYVQQKLLILNHWEIKKPSTKTAIATIQKLKLASAKKKVLFILPESHPYLELSLRNLQNYQLTTPFNLSIYQLINVDKLVIFQDSLPLIKERFI